MNGLLEEWITENMDYMNFITVLVETENQMIIEIPVF